MKLNLGFSPPDYGSTPSPVEVKAESKEPPVYYPSITIEDQPGLADGLEPGQEITATVRMRVTLVEKRKGARRYEPENKKETCRVELDVISMDTDAVKDSAEEESKPDFTKIPSKNKYPAPSKKEETPEGEE